jgi:uncharacterized Zn finger protein (UPF0148 family)
MQPLGAEKAPLTDISPGQKALEEFRRMRETHSEAAQGEREEEGEVRRKEGKEVAGEEQPRRDPADEIAAKMLQGWTLLGIHCPR